VEGPAVPLAVQQTQTEPRFFNSNTPFSTLRSVEQVDTLTQVVENERDWQAADLLLSMNLAKVRNVARVKQ
jgi:hypothetical protein